MPIAASHPIARRLIPVLLIASMPLHAAAAEAPASVDPSLLKVDPRLGLGAPNLTQSDDLVVLHPGAAWYPEAEAATGAQGGAIVVMDLARDGSVTATRIARSTHSPALDAQALRLASQLHWMGARTMPAQASLRVLFSRDTTDSVQKKSCAELNVDVGWLKAHDPALPPENVGALRSIRGLVSFNTSWMPDRRDREAGQPARDALFVASRRAIDECAAHPDQSLKEIFNHELHEAAKEHEKAPATPYTAPDTGPLPRSILHTQRDDPFYAGSLEVLGRDPAYPPAALAAGAQGEVEARAELGDEGTIERVVVHRDYSGSPALADAALDVLRRRLAVAHLEKKDPATLPAAIVMTVDFKRDDSESIATLDCATYQLDRAAWKKGSPLRLPDFRTLDTTLGMRAFGLQGADARRPLRGMPTLADKGKLALMQALDAACEAAPRKLAIDALIDVIDAIDAMPDRP